jgi:hypothetical protein
MVAQILKLAHGIFVVMLGWTLGISAFICFLWAGLKLASWLGLW